MGRIKDQLLNEAEGEDGIDILGIAMVKSYAFIMEYDPVSGREVEKHGYHFIRDGYIDGFLAGVAFKFEQTDN